MASVNGYGPFDATRSARVVSYVVSCTCLVACAVIQLWYIRTDQPVGIDEGYMGALALRLIDGNMLPGVDGVGQRGPVLYWLIAAAQLLLGPYHWWGFRVLAWLACSAVIISLLALTVIARRPFAGAIGAVFYAYTMLHRFDPGAGIAVGGEQIGVPWLCGATAMIALALSTRSARKRMICGAVAGVMASLAGWTKVTLMVGVAPLALWVLADSLRDAQPTWRGSVMALLPLTVGWLLPSALIAALYAASGHYSDLIYRFFTYNRQVHMGAYHGVDVAPLIARWFSADPWTAYWWLGCTLALLIHLGYHAGASRSRGVIAAIAAIDLHMVVLLQAAAGFAIGIVQMRFWPHHFVAALPWAGLLLGLTVEWLASGLWPRVRVGIAVVVLLAVGGGLSWTASRDVKARELERKAGAWQPSRNERLCREIQRYSRPSDYIFVWGFDGDLYVSCRRRPASRFVYTTMIAGIVPPFWEYALPERVARRAVQQTLYDLKKTKPALIVNMTDWVGRVPITSIPELRAVVEKDYCKLRGVGGKDGRRARIYARTSSSHCGNALPSSE